MIRAGFDPKDAIRFFGLMKRNSNIVDVERSTHPKNENRVWQLENELKNLNTQLLKNEGKKNILSSRPLTYQKYLDRLNKGRIQDIKYIVINSKYGSTSDVNEPFKKLFGK